MVYDSNVLVPVRLHSERRVYEGLVDQKFFSTGGIYEMRVTSPEEVSKLDRLTVRKMPAGAYITEMQNGLHKTEVQIPVVIEKIDDNQTYQAGN
jgi:hypothetical protein